MPFPAYHGLLVLDKPGGITSRAAVDRAAAWFPRGTRIGHTGTLDPLATGVLVLCTGAATRFAEYVQDMRKTYRAGLLLGATSDTDDADGIVTKLDDAVVPDRLAVERALAEFVGAIDQVPPAYSAARVTGRRAHELARRGQEFDLQPRRVKIHSIELVALDYPNLDIEVHCGKGTYIRSLARDLGRRLGCGGLVTALRRTKVGPFAADFGLSLDSDAPTALARLLPLAAAVALLPRINVRDDEAEKLRCGQALRWIAPAYHAAGAVAVFDEANNLVAVARLDGRENLLRPEKVVILR